MPYNSYNLTTHLTWLEQFTVTYDLGWDTLMVYELQRRNSGRPGGLFLVKGKHRRPDKHGIGRLGQTLALTLDQQKKQLAGWTTVLLYGTIHTISPRRLNK